MDWLTFTIKLIDSLAWPVTTMIVVTMLRKKVLDLIPKLTKLEVGSLKAEFSNEVKQTLMDAAKIKPAEDGSSNDINLGLIPVDESLHQDPRSIAMWRSASINPSIGITDAWKDIELSLLNIISNRGVFVPHRNVDNVGKWIQAIAISKILPIETIAVIYELYGLKNKVIQSELVATPNAAQDYLLAAQRIIRILDTYVLPQ